LPPAKRDVVRDVMHAAGIRISHDNKDSSSTTDAITITTSDTHLTIGDVSVPIHQPTRPEMVPDPLFFEIPSHTIVLQNMLRDIVSGERHLLLLGPQGCGKNKLR